MPDCRIPVTQLLLALSCLLPGALTAAPQEPATSITLAPLSTLTFQPQLSAPATSLSLNDSRISAETSGRILQLPVRVGDQIAAGDLIAQLDCRSNRIQLKKVEAAVQAADARVTLAERQFKRSQALRQGKSISEELYNQREADVATSRADLQAQQALMDEARLAVEHCRLTAPFDAIVLERLTSEGEWIAPGQGVIRLLDRSQLEVSAQLPIDLADALQVASDIASEILFEDSSGRYPLRLRRLQPVIERLSRNREARLLFTGPAALPGSSGRILWHDPRPHLPADIPVRREGQLGIFTAEDDTARFIPLEHALEGQPAAVALPGETRIIIEGRLGLNPGDPIRLEPAQTVPQANTPVGMK